MFNDLECCKAYDFFERLGLWSPINSVFKLQPVSKKGGTPQGQVFVLQLLRDRIEIASLDSSAIPVIALNGWLGDMCKFIFQSSQFFLDTWFPTLGVPIQIAHLCSSKMKTPQLLRQHVVALPDTDCKADRTWMSTLGDHDWCQGTVELFAEFLSEYVLGKHYEPSIKSCIGGHKQAVDVVDYAQVSLVLKAIQNKYVSEQTAWAEAQVLAKQKLDDAAADDIVAPEQEKQVDAPQAAEVAPMASHFEEAEPAASSTDPIEPSDQEKLAAAMDQVPVNLRGRFTKKCCVLTVLEMNTKKFWMTQARIKREQLCHVLFLPSDVSHRERVRRLKAEPFVQPISKKDGNAIIHFDVKQMGEAVTNPSTRVVNFNSLQFRRLLEALLEARYDVEKSPIGEKDLFCAVDGGKTSLGAKMMRTAYGSEETLKTQTKRQKVAAAEFNSEEEQLEAEDDEVDEVSRAKAEPSKYLEKKMTFWKSESSMELRAKERGGLTRQGPLNKSVQEEKVHMLAHRTCWNAMPDIQSLHWPDQSNGGRMMGPLDICSIRDEWKATIADKKVLFGGSRPDGAGRRKADDVEVCFWFGLPPMYFEDLKHRFHNERCGFFDLSMGNGNTLFVDMKDRCPCLGFGLSEAHVNAIEDQTDWYMLQMMLDARVPQHFSHKAFLVFKDLMGLGEAGATTSATQSATQSAQAEPELAVPVVALESVAEVERQKKEV